MNLIIGRLIDQAEKGIGLYYKDKDNKLSWELKDILRKANLPEDASWCLVYIQHIIKAIEDNNNLLFDIPKNIYHVSTFWNKTKEEYKLHVNINNNLEPKAGMLAIYKHQKTEAGHAEIIKEVLNKDYIITIGANTSNPDKTSNQYRGVFMKKRRISGNIEEKRIIGYINLEKALLFKGDTLSSL
jgi:hypothetical protein